MAMLISVQSLDLRPRRSYTADREIQLKGSVNIGKQHENVEKIKQRVSVEVEVEVEVESRDAAEGRI